MEVKQSSFNKWYESNKDEYNEKRRKKYSEDSEYRERVKKYRTNSGKNRGINRTVKGRHQKAK